MTVWMILKVLFIILNDESIIIFCLIGFSDVFNRDWRFFRCFQLRRGDDDGLFFSRQQVEKVVGKFCPLNGYFHEHILCQIVAPQRNRVFTVGICNLLFDGGFGEIQFVWPVEIIIFLGNRLAVFIAQPSSFYRSAKHESRSCVFALPLLSRKQCRFSPCSMCWALPIPFL